MLTKSVKSVISVVLKHVARAKKIRAIGVIRECYNIRMGLPDSNIWHYCLHSALTTLISLITNGLRRVDSPEICLHYHLHNTHTEGTFNSYGGEIFLLEQQKNLSPITVSATWRDAIVHKPAPNSADTSAHVFKGYLHSKTH